MKFNARLSCIALVLALAFAAAGRATAQPCGASVITIGNSTPCTVTLCLRTNLGPICQTLNPGASVVVPLVAAVNIMGVISAGGVTYVFVPSPIPGIQWVPNVTLPPAGCCCDVYYDPSTCSLRIVPSSSVPPCNP
jgi:hypothetical protein